MPSELEQWAAGRTIDVLVTVDNATGGWVGPVGVVTKLLQRIKVNADAHDRAWSAARGC